MQPSALRREGEPGSQAWLKKVGGASAPPEIRPVEYRRPIAPAAKLRPRTGQRTGGRVDRPAASPLLRQPAIDGAIEMCAAYTTIAEKGIERLRALKAVA